MGFPIQREHDNSYPLYTALVIGLTREQFVALGLPSWTHLRTRYWGVLHCKDLNICFVGLAYGITKAGE